MRQDLNTELDIQISLILFSRGYTFTQIILFVDWSILAYVFQPTKRRGKKRKKKKKKTLFKCTLHFKMFHALHSCQTALSSGTTFHQPYNFLIPTHKRSCACHSLYYAADHLFGFDFQHPSESSVKLQFQNIAYTQTEKRVYNQLVLKCVLLPALFIAVQCSACLQVLLQSSATGNTLTRGNYLKNKK